MVMGRIESLYSDIIKCIKEKGINPETVFGLATKNVAKILKIYPKKGTLREGSDADIIILNKDFGLNKLFCMGRLMVDEGEPTGLKIGEEFNA